MGTTEVEALATLLCRTQAELVGNVAPGAPCDYHRRHAVALLASGALATNPLNVRAVESHEGFEMPDYGYEPQEGVDYGIATEHDVMLTLARAKQMQRAAWAEGYLRGTLDTTSDLEPADNPYKEQS